MKLNSFVWFITGTILLCLLTPLVSATFTFSISGSPSHFLGDDIVMSGVDTESSTVYLFLTGPNLPAQGAQIASIEPRLNGVQNGNSDTFTKVSVPPSTTWSWIWSTGNVDLEAGSYAIYAVIEPRDKNTLGSVSYSSASLIFKKPFTTSSKRTVLVNPNAVVFIGESGLDISGVTGTANTLAWWAPAADIYTTAPSKVIDVTTTKNNFFVSPGGFLGYEGNWYAYNPPNPPSPSLRFTVADPALDLRIWDKYHTTDLTGSSVPAGTDIAFQIQTNMYQMANSGRVNSGSDSDGYIDLNVTGPDGGKYWSLFNQSDLPQPLSGLSVDHQPFIWGEPLSPSDSSWATGSIVNGNYRYPAGTYRFRAESTLNGMKDNYRNGGADYTGKTVSPAVTLTLTEPWKDAYSYIEGTVLGGNPSGKPVYVSSIPLPPHSVVDTWGSKVTHTTPSGPESGWLFFIDDNPEANWEHPGRFYLIDETNPSTIIDHWASWSPPTTVALEYAGGTPPAPAGSNALGGAGGSFSVPALGATAAAAIPACKPDCSNYQALLISGGVDKYNNYYRYWNDISFMYKALNQTYGYPAENITVLMSDGTDAGSDQLSSYGPPPAYTPNYASSNVNLDGKYGATDVSGSATRANVIAALTSLNNKLSSDDTLFIFTTNHGGNTSNPASNAASLYLWNGESITDADFVAGLPRSPGNITIMMEQCFGGGFIDNFIGATTTQKRVITTAANWNEYSWGNAFSYPWISAVAGHDNAYPQPNAVNADTATVDGKVSMSEAYNFAKANDGYFTRYSPPKETPQLAVKNADSTAKFLSECKPVPTIKVTEPDTTITWVAGTPRTVRWTQKGLSGLVKIELWKGATPVYVRDIGSADALAGSTGYPWTLPTIAAGSDYRVKIYSVNDPSVSDFSDTTFTIGTFSRDGKGVLKVNSTPYPTQPGNTGGASIFIGGTQQKDASGKDILTNTSFTLWAGTYFVGVYLDGYYRKDPTQYNVPIGGNVTAMFPLDKITPNDCKPYGTLIIHTTPVQGARVLINGKENGQNTNAVTELAPGTYTVQVALDGYATPAAQTIIIPPPQCGSERQVTADFTLQKIPDVSARIWIVPNPLNIGRNGYFVAFVALPNAYNAADVDAGSVVCEGAPARRIIRVKVFPHLFAALFSRADLSGVSPAAKVPMTLSGMIKKVNGNILFSGSTNIRLIMSMVIAKEETDDALKLNDQQVFSRFYSG
jgi:hypothetical protein